MHSAFVRLQDYINNYIHSRLGEAKELFWLKAEYWNDKTLHTNIRDEIYKASCELVALHEKNPVLHIITNFSDLKNVLWESTFIESLSLEEKKKYREAENLVLDFGELKKDVTIYDQRIPYFSELLSAIYFSEYIAFLQSKLPQEKTTENLSPLIVKSDFEAQFNPTQIELLTECINKVRMFSETISNNTLKEIFSCALSHPLKTRNNRLLVYFFSALDDRSLITRNWQSVIDKNRLFLSSGKRNPLTQTDLSSANTEIKITSPKDSEIIDNYLKELKKH